MKTAAMAKQQRIAASGLASLLSHAHTANPSSNNAAKP